MKSASSESPAEKPSDTTTDRATLGASRNVKRGREPDVYIAGLGTALPEYEMDQTELANWVCEHLDHDRRTAMLTRRLFKSSEVEARYSTLPDCVEPENARLYRKGGLPTLEERMQIYRSDAPPLAGQAARRALEQARVEARDITHLFVVTSTAAYAPGPDVEIVHALGLSPEVQRSLVCMMGCSGAFNALATARSCVALDPDALALIICVELSSIHLQRSTDVGGIVAQSLFGDSAAAAVLRSGLDGERAVARLGHSRSFLKYAARDLVSWNLTHSGFEIELAKDLAATIQSDTPQFLAPLIRTETGGDRASDVRSWVVYLGGSKVLDAVENSLSLPPTALASAREVYARGGNLSSASILFVLERESARCAAGTPGIMYGVGPGLALEGLAFTHEALG
jgi:predicted naringenin-chalcone synthase